MDDGNGNAYHKLDQTGADQTLTQTKPQTLARLQNLHGRQLYVLPQGQ
jgi:hypothetical protein